MRQQPSYIRLFAFLIALTGLGACHRDHFSGPLWFYSPSRVHHSRWDTVLDRVSFIDLEPDGRFTRYFDRFEYGKWSLVDDRLFLTAQDSLTYVCVVTVKTDDDLRLRLSAQKIAHFEPRPRPSRDSATNPFSVCNNRWRIPAARKESVAEIRERLLNHLHFWEAYLQWGDDNNVGSLDVTDIPSPLKMHGNGFGLVRYEFLSPRWRACFFSDADCHTGDSLIRQVFKRTDIKWPDTNDEGKKFISGIQQLEAALQSE
ncbi:MAG TPA: hypothetical protein VN616_04125 [Puia sp.]|nr:hypothetical protein [Puia sp.]